MSPGDTTKKMSDHRSIRRTSLLRVVVAGAVLGALAACSDPAPDPDPDGPATTTPSTSATETEPTETDPTADVDAAAVRATLGAVDPCGLLAGDSDDSDKPGGATARYAEGPHTCEGQLGDLRVRVEVGVPFDEAARAAAEPQDVAGLTAYDQTDLCRLVFPVGSSHGIAVEAGDDCAGVAEAGAIVGAALAADIDSALRTPGPDAHTACGLLTDATDDPDLLLDAVGDMSQGLDFCEVATGAAVLARTRLSLDYTQMPFDEMARILKGDRSTVVGQDVVTTDRTKGVCFLHTYLWPSRPQGQGKVWTEAVISAATCGEARTVAGAVITAADREPTSPGSVADLLAATG